MMIVQAPAPFPATPSVSVKNCVIANGSSENPDVAPFSRYHRIVDILGLVLSEVSFATPRPRGSAIALLGVYFRKNSGGGALVSERAFLSCRQRLRGNSALDSRQSSCIFCKRARQIGDGGALRGRSTIHRRATRRGGPAPHRDPTGACHKARSTRARKIGRQRTRLVGHPRKHSAPGSPTSGAA